MGWFNAEWAKTVTMHQLLAHSSGIKNYTSLPDFEKQKFPKNSDLITFLKIIIWNLYQEKNFHAVTPIIIY